jgi:aspartyl-tRNA(Asn)/glutamyl-tRNA(Gln) amidotransferase subunit A
LDQAIQAITAMGGRVIDVDLPLIDHAIAAYYIVAPAEACSNLARFDGIRYGAAASINPGSPDALLDLYCQSRAKGFGPEVKRRIMLGTHVLSSGYYDAYYAKAMKARRSIATDFDRAFALGCHALLTPTAPTPPFLLGEMSSDPLAMYLADVYTVPANLAGLPAISIPAGTTTLESAVLPIGLQLVGRAFDESVLLRVARCLERALPRFASRH